jgi:hypothetical protein
MALLDILEVSGYVIGGISVGFTGLVGVIQGRTNYDCAMHLYKDLPENAKEVIGKPKKIKIYLQSLLGAPKFIYCTSRNKPAGGAFMDYVQPLEDKFGEGYIRLLILKQILKD